MSPHVRVTPHRKKNSLPFPLSRGTGFGEVRVSSWGRWSTLWRRAGTFRRRESSQEAAWGARSPDSHRSHPLSALQPRWPTFCASAAPRPFLPLGFGVAVPHEGLTPQFFTGQTASSCRPGLSHQLHQEAFSPGALHLISVSFTALTPICCQFFTKLLLLLLPLEHKPQEGRTSSVWFPAGSPGPRAGPSHTAGAQFELVQQMKESIVQSWEWESQDHGWQWDLPSSVTPRISRKGACYL